MSMTLDGGDFITKFYNMQILLARINSLPKRLYPNNYNKYVLEYNVLILNILSNTIEYNQKSQEVTTNELSILYYLFMNKGKIVPRVNIMEYL